jgi:hypothetical protein
MAMIVTDGFGREPPNQTFECLRCGHVGRPQHAGKLRQEAHAIAS